MASPQMLYKRTQKCAVSLANKLRAVAVAPMSPHKEKKMSLKNEKRLLLP